MQTPRASPIVKLRSVLVVLVLGTHVVVATVVRAQSSPPSPPARGHGTTALPGDPNALPAIGTDAETVTLPVFEVRDKQVGGYGAREATATTRISTPLHDIAQSVSVVTRELMDDTHGLQMVDVARFATPIFANSNGAGDVYSLRGFRTLQRFVDGVQIGAQGNSMWSDLSNIERMEIVKGPNAILVPGANYGGKVNLITKSPKFDDFARFTLQVRSYLGSEASLDANRVLRAGKTAARLVVTGWDSRGYFDGQFRRGWLIAPSITHRFSRDTELIVKLESLENRESNLMGVALDPAVGTSVGGFARKHPLLPRDNQWPPAGEYRSRKETRISAELRFPIADRVAARLWVMADEVLFVTPTPGGAEHDAGLQGSRNPVTGEWEPFKSFTYDATTGVVTETELQPSSSTRFTRVNHGVQQHDFGEIHLKNDYVGTYDLGATVRATTLAGFSANWQYRVKSKAWRVTRPAVDYATGRPVGPDEPYTSILTRDKEAEQQDIQVFVVQQLHLADNRLIVSGGVAKFLGVLRRLDDSLLPPTLERTTRNNVTDFNFGVIYKPRPEISVFAGYNRVGGALPLSTSAGEFPTDSFRVGVGEQREVGIKVSSWQDRLAVSAAFFDIVQDNVQVTNPAWRIDPRGEPRYLFYDLLNRGWEVEASGLVTPSLELVGNFTHMHMRDTFGAPQLMVPDAAGALFAHYTIRQGRWKGIGASVGLDHVGRQPGSTLEGIPGQSMFTPAGVPNQPSFYLAPRTLLQAGIGYRSERWRFSVVVHNLTNRNYIRAAANRFSMEPGEPRNYSLTFELGW